MLMKRVYDTLRHRLYKPVRRSAVRANACCLRKRIRRAFILLSAALLAAALLSGCGEDEGIYRYGSAASTFSGGRLNGEPHIAEASADEGADASSAAEETDASSAPGEKAAGASSGNGEKSSDAASVSEKEEPSAEVCYVYVCGAVNAPGVYELPAGSRVYEAVAKAGGMTGEADGRSLNQAAPVEDGQQITVYTREEAEELRRNGGAGTAQFAGSAGTRPEEESDRAKVNINTAGRDELMTLKGIGAARAEAIITYREEHGAFSRIEDIMNVEGIKEKAFAKIRDDIAV
ncbi:MAG: helix-hairpin-helix domain-containing protein [Bilifractor sp.]